MTPPREEAHETLSDELLEKIALLAESKPGHAWLGRSSIVAIMARELQSRRASPNPLAKADGEAVTRPMIEFMAELREKREAEVRAAAIEITDQMIEAAAAALREVLDVFEQDRAPALAKLALEAALGKAPEAAMKSPALPAKSAKF